MISHGGGHSIKRLKRRWKDNMGHAGGEPKEDSEKSLLKKELKRKKQKQSRKNNRKKRR